jgi:hypothetical protein
MEITIISAWKTRIKIITAGFNDCQGYIRLRSIKYPVHSFFFGGKIPVSIYLFVGETDRSR